MTQFVVVRKDGEKEDIMSLGEKKVFSSKEEIETLTGKISFFPPGKYFIYEREVSPWKIVEEVISSNTESF